jgi:hypothetical protein
MSSAVANTNVQNDSLTGYSADKEGSTMGLTGLPPGIIDLYHKQKRKPTDTEERNKRRKISESNYAAATVKADLVRAGRSYPLVNTKRSRIHPGIDLSKVHLISSKSVESSPFLHAVSCGWTSVRYDVLTDFGTVYGDMLSQTAASYQPGIVTPRRSTSPAGSDSSSSLSDTESDDSGGSANLLVGNARLDESNMEHSTPADEQQTTRCISCPPSVCITMEEALGVCDSSRLITLSSPPYKIVFCNAAFAALTGLSSDETLGKSLLDIAVQGKPGKISLESCAASSSEGDSTTVFCRQDSSASIKCGMKVTPIKSVSDAHELNDITHFAVDLSDDTMSSDATKRETADVSGKSTFITLMG